MPRYEPHLHRHTAVHRIRFTVNDIRHQSQIILLDKFDDRVRIPEAEAWRFLEQSINGTVTTLRRNGRPVALPAWFVVLDSRIYVRTRGKKLTRTRHDRRCPFLSSAMAPCSTTSTPSSQGASPTRWDRSTPPIERPPSRCLPRPASTAPTRRAASSSCGRSERCSRGTTDVSGWPVPATAPVPPASRMRRHLGAGH